MNIVEKFSVNYLQTRCSHITESYIYPKGTGLFNKCKQINVRNQNNNQLKKINVLIVGDEEMTQWIKVLRQT